MMMKGNKMQIALNILGGLGFAATGFAFAFAIAIFG